MNVAVGYLLGRMSANAPLSLPRGKIKSDMKHSCEWWIEQCNLEISKPKMCSMLQGEVRKGTIQKEMSAQGLTIFVPTDRRTEKELIQKWSKR